MPRSMNLRPEGGEEIGDDHQHHAEDVLAPIGPEIGKEGTQLVHIGGMSPSRETPAESHYRGGDDVEIDARRAHADGRRGLRAGGQAGRHFGRQPQPGSPVSAGGYHGSARRRRLPTRRRRADAPAPAPPPQAGAGQARSRPPSPSLPLRHRLPRRSVAGAGLLAGGGGRARSSPQAPASPPRPTRSSGRRTRWVTRSRPPSRAT